MVLYCSCPSEITSARVARLLMQKGIKHVLPLAGGLQGWRARGYPLGSPCPSRTLLEPPGPAEYTIA